MKINLKKGDEILTGKWQNKKVKVKTIGKNELNQPTINGKPMLKFRIKKLMPKKDTDVKESLQHLKTFNQLFETDSKIYTLKEVQTAQSSFKVFSADVIFGNNKDTDTFELVNIPIEDIKEFGIVNMHEFKTKRAGTDEDVAIVNELISIFKKTGELTPIVVDEKNSILDGLHRYAAYQSLKKETIPAFKKILNTNESESFNFNGFIEGFDWMETEITIKNINQELIKNVIDFYTVKTNQINLKLLDDENKELLKQETIELLKDFTDDLNNLYRGVHPQIGTTITHEDKIHQDDSNVESWTFDYDTAEAFTFKGKGKVIEKKYTKLNILFCLDVFFASLSLETIKQLPNEYQKQLEDYVSESEILIYKT